MTYLEAPAPAGRPAPEPDEFRKTGVQQTSIGLDGFRPGHHEHRLLLTAGS
ncbi:hypothetical protein HMPREF0058_0503 [Actinomyces urogenitalis DSM 15434]|uniref:Uncharacterized protein n=1 Tax=Actinomyces urogenitalis DSM 15434 TaxID=525246 RepID=C0W3Q9_9ACTO|nr:hypothetical protein HMPREF0058_0503 [Actinomyces urogenitalis DSM 15434]